MNNWIRAGVSMLVLGAVILVTGLLLPLSIEHDQVGSIDCGSAVSVAADTAVAGEESGCEQAATDRRTMVYLLSGAIGGIGLILLGFGEPPGGRFPRHPLGRIT